MRTKKFIMGLALISVTHQSFAFEMGGHKIGGGYNPPPTPKTAKVEAPAVTFVSSTTPIVNKLGKNPFNTEIAARIETALGKFTNAPSLNPSVVFYETFPAKNILPLTDVKMIARSDDSDSVVLTDYVSIPGQDAKGSALGLRMALAPLESRQKASQQMAENGLIKTGDIIVSTRPLFANSLQYLALQLLSTHISMAVVVSENGRKFVYNLDMPMDAEMLGGKAGFGKSAMDANHFSSDNSNLMLHILRPRLETEQQRQNIQKWFEKALTKAREKKIYPAQLSFNTDYNSPMYREVSGKADLAFVADTARLLLDQKLTANDHLQQYCSEFAWTLLSLKDCNPDNTASDFKKGKTPSCISEFFKPMQMFGSAFSSGSASEQDYYGMTDGIPMLISQTGASPQLSMQLIDFALPGSDKEAKGLSAGHKGVAKLMAPLIQQANGYFKLTLTGDAKKIDGARAQLNPNSIRNYSPTGFVVHAAMPDSINGQKVAQKKLDYVVTIKYVPKAKLKDLQSK